MKRSFKVILIISAAAVLALDFIRPEYTASATKNEMIGTIITRTLGALIFLLLIKQGGTGIFGITRDKEALLCILPALAVAINNFPIIALLGGSAKLHGDLCDILLLALQSAAVGLFEESAFRGFFFPMVLEKFRGRSVFVPTVLSSAAFAAVHLLNLLYGASLPATLLQVGYSFLIGGMCAVLLLKTRCIWVCAAVHAIYNFGGTLVPTLGSGKIWDAATVTLTALIGVVVLAVMLTILANVNENETNALTK